MSDSPELPFFDGDKLTDAIQERVDFCRAYDAETQRTQTFCAPELDVLAMQSMRQQGAEQDMVRFRAIDAEKLGPTPSSSTNCSGTALASVTAHLFSLDRWARSFAGIGALRGR